MQISISKNEMILGIMLWLSTRHEIGGHQWQLFKWKTIGENLEPYTRKDIRKFFLIGNTEVDRTYEI